MLAEKLVHNKFLGFGLGLRSNHYEDILRNKPKLDWLEILSENYMVDGGKPKRYLHQIRELYPMVMHGVSLSIGSTDPLDMKYLKDLKTLVDEVEPEWVSDHICWTSNAHVNSHDLMPLPYNEVVIKHVADRVKRVQDYLGRQILLENVSSYLQYDQDEMQEWEFLNELAQRADCKLLFDINNVYVSSRNHNFDPLDYIKGIDKKFVAQFHLAGHTDNGNYVVDTHDEPVRSEVWDLYKEALKHYGRVSTMIERDGNIPSFDELYSELMYAKKIASEVPGIIDLENNHV